MSADRGPFRVERRQHAKQHVTVSAAGEAVTTPQRLLLRSRKNSECLKAVNSLAVLAAALAAQRMREAFTGAPRTALEERNSCERPIERTERTVVILR
jgi:hypothetical protein